MENTFFNHLTSNYEMFFAPAGSCQMDGIVSLYNYIMTYLTAILCVVTTALIFIIVIHLHGERHLKQFKKEENLEELLNWLKYLQRWTHSTVLELVWTIIPTIILIAIAIPSFILLYSLDEIVDTQSVVKIIGYQWYWKYEYPVMDVSKDDVVTFSYLSYMLPFDDLTNEKNRRLLEVDAPLVLPTNVNSKLVITAKDVLHSFAVPALGLKMDAVPGRLNQITVHIFKSGMFYGQCSELCGVNHGFMPIAVAAVDFNTFEHFLAQCAGVEAQNIEEIEKIEEITTDETDPSWVGVIIGAVTGYFFGSSLGAYLGTTYGADYGSTLGTNLDNKFGFTNQPVFGPLLSAFFAYVGFTYGASFGGWGGSFLATFIGSIYDFANNIVTDPSLSCTIAYLYGSFFGSFFGAAFGFDFGNSIAPVSRFSFSFLTVNIEAIFGLIAGSILGCSTISTITTVLTHYYGSYFGAYYGGILGNRLGSNFGNWVQIFFNLDPYQFQGLELGSIYGTSAGFVIGSVVTSPSLFTITNSINDIFSYLFNLNSFEPQVNTSTEDSKPHPTTDMIADWSRLPICIPCLDDHVYEPYNSIFLDLRELVGKYGWTGTDEQVEFIRPHVKNINAYVINKSDARKDAIEKGKDMTDMLSIYCDYRFVPTKCLDDRIKWSEYPNPLKLLFEDMKTSPLFSVPEDAVWEEKK